MNLGSVFKTFTVALALEESIFDTNSNINNITKQIKCSNIHNYRYSQISKKNDS